MVPADNHLWTPRLLEHVKHLGLEDGVDRLHTHPRPALWHGKHVDDPHSVVVHEVPQHEPHDLHGHARAPVLEHLEKRQTRNVNLLRGVDRGRVRLHPLPPHPQHALETVHVCTLRPPPACYRRSHARSKALRSIAAWAGRAKHGGVGVRHGDRGSGGCAPQAGAPPAVFLGNAAHLFTCRALARARSLLYPPSLVQGQVAFKWNSWRVRSMLQPMSSLSVCHALGARGCAVPGGRTPPLEGRRARARVGRSRVACVVVGAVSARAGGGRGRVEACIAAGVQRMQRADVCSAMCWWALLSTGGVYRRLSASCDTG